MSDADDSGPGRREVAFRLFAAEFDDAEFDYSESDEERAPNYVVTPTGARANRLFAVGVLTEVESVNPEMVRGRVVDPTGAFVTYAGQYQPEALAVLERTEPPAFVALSGKARTFEPDDDDDVVYSSVRPESVSAVDAETRDRWVVTAAERTLDRVGVAAAAIESGLTGDALRAALADAGVDDRLADGVALALEYYDTTPAYLGALRETALDAARVVADEADEADAPALAPGDSGGPDAPTAADLATMELSAPATAGDAGGAGATTTAEPDPEPEPVEATAGAGTDVEPTTSTPGDDTAETDVESTAATADTGADSGAGADMDTEADADADVDADAAVDPDGETDTEADVETEIGDLEAATADAEEPGEFEPGEFDLDEETRQEVEEEYGTEFSTADEVEEADIETPEPDTEAEADEPAGDDDDDDGTGADVDAEADEPESDPEETADEDEAEADAGGDEDEDVDLEDAVMTAMETVGDGDGADREALVAAVVDEHGVDPEAVEEAIQDALMSGRCYEPADGTLKAI